MKPLHGGHCLPFPVFVVLHLVEAGVLANGLVHGFVSDETSCTIVALRSRFLNTRQVGLELQVAAYRW